MREVRGTFYYRIFIALGVILLYSAPARSQFADDDIKASLVINESGGETVVSESGFNDAYEIQLEVQPADLVHVFIQGIGDPNLIIVEPVELTFTQDNWFIPQVVTVAAVNDQKADGDAKHLIVLQHTAESDDERYDNMSPVSLPLWAEDDDCGSWGYWDADVNRDCRVDMQDLLAMAAQWLECTCVNN